MSSHHGTFNRLDSALEDLFKSRVYHFGTHIEVSLPPNSDRLINQVKFNISSRYGNLPVLFNYGNGQIMEWWIDGACHHPSEPSIVVSRPGVKKIKYSDENGFPHREGGPAVINRVRDGKGSAYEESWKISPGIFHRTDGGPAHIMVKYDNEDDPETWGRFVLERGGAQVLVPESWKDKFSPDAKMHNASERRRMWYRNGEPFRKNGKYTEYVETNAYEIISINPALSVKMTTFTIMKEFRWLDEKGRLSRHNGPAVIKLYMTREESEGNKTKLLEYGDSSVEWHYHGVELTKKDVEKWMKKNDIKLMKNNNIIDRAFAPEDEFCFVADFLSPLGIEDD